MFLNFEGSSKASEEDSRVENEQFIACTKRKVRQHLCIEAGRS
jgi:hypothetical protein